LLFFGGWFLGCAQVDDTTFDITELPVRKWTQDYKEFLEGLVETKEKTKETKESKENAQAAVKDKQSITIKDYKEFHTDTTVHFRVSMSPEQMAVAEEMGLVKAFKLETSVSTR
jgi:DNA topoisomerase-2